MSGVERGPNVGPRKALWVAAVDDAVARLDAMIGRWTDSIPPHVRAELHAIREPLEALLICAGLRGRRRPRRPPRLGG